MKKVISLILCLCIFVAMNGSVYASAYETKDANIKPKVTETKDKRVVSVTEGEYTYVAQYDKVKNTIKLDTTNTANNSLIKSEFIDLNMDIDIDQVSHRDKRSYSVIKSKGLSFCGLYYKLADVGNGDYKWYIQSINSLSKTQVIHGSNNFGRFEDFRKAVDDADAAMYSAIIKATAAVVTVLAPYIKKSSSETLLGTTYAKITALFVAAGIALSAVADGVMVAKSCGEAELQFILI